MRREYSESPLPPNGTTQLPPSIAPFPKPAALHFAQRSIRSLLMSRFGIILIVTDHVPPVWEVACSIRVYMVSNPYNKSDITRGAQIVTHSMISSQSYSAACTLRALVPCSSNLSMPTAVDKRALQAEGSASIRCSQGRGRLALTPWVVRVKS